jgi:hypothetical protein
VEADCQTEDGFALRLAPAVRAPKLKSKLVSAKIYSKTYGHLFDRHVLEFRVRQLQERRVDVNSELVKDPFDRFGIFLKTVKL